MSETKARLGAGNVDVTLLGETHVLKPTLDAAMTLSRQHGGLMDLIQQIGRMDFDAIVLVLQKGLGLSGDDAKALPEKVYATGLLSLVAPCTKYVHVLLNGGRQPGKKGDDSEGNPPSA